MGFWTRSLSVGCGMPYYLLTCETHFGECVPIIEMNQDEHGGRMGGYFWVQQGIFGHNQFNNHGANPIRPCPRKMKKLNVNQVVPFHIWWNKVQKKNVGSGVDLMRKSTTP